MTPPPANVSRYAIPWPPGDVDRLRGLEGSTARLSTFLHTRTTQVRTSRTTIDRWGGVAREAFFAKSDLVAEVAASMATMMENSSISVRTLANELESAQAIVTALADDVAAKHDLAVRRRSAAYQEGQQANSIYWLKVNSDGDEYDAQYEQAYREYRWADTVADNAEADYTAELEAARRAAQREVDRVEGIDRSTAQVLAQPVMPLPLKVAGLSLITYGSGPLSAWMGLTERDAERDAERLMELLDDGSITSEEYDELTELLAAAAATAAADPEYGEALVESLGAAGVAIALYGLAVVSQQVQDGKLHGVSPEDLFSSLAYPFGQAVGAGLSEDVIRQLGDGWNFALPVLMAAGALEGQDMALAATLSMQNPEYDFTRIPDSWRSLIGGSAMSVYWREVALTALMKDSQATAMALDMDVEDGVTLAETLLQDSWTRFIGYTSVGDVFMVGITQLMADGNVEAASGHMERLLHEILPDGRDHGDEMMVELVATLAALYYIDDLHRSAYNASGETTDWSENGLVTWSDENGIWLNERQLEQLFSLIDSDTEARQVFLAGVGAHRQQQIAAGIAGGDLRWVEEIGNFDQYYANGHHLAEFASAEDARQAIADRQAVFDFATGLIPGVSLGKSIGAQVAGKLVGEVQGLIFGEIKGAFGSAPSDIDVALENRAYQTNLRNESVLAIVQGLIDTGDLPAPPRSVAPVRYEYVAGTYLPTGGVQLLSLEQLNADPQLRYDWKSWLDEQRAASSEIDDILNRLAQSWGLVDLDL